jgi:flagellar L-ring protein precursor FlgH
MRNARKPADSRRREFIRRSLLLMAGSLICFFLAAMRARGGEGYFLPNNRSWYSQEEEDEDVMSYDDHVTADRLRRLVIGDRPLYHRRKASNPHDSVTIVVAEKTTSSLASANDLSRDSSNQMTLQSWLTPKLSGGLGATQHGAAAGGNTPTIAYSNSRSHASDSTIDRSQSFITTITGEVVEVLNNGHLVVEARKSVNVNGEEQTVKLTGIVNPDFMDSSSSIKADLIMDMRIVYSGDGPMTRMDKRGWAAKLIDFLNPF